MRLRLLVTAEPMWLPIGVIAISTPIVKRPDADDEQDGAEYECEKRAPRERG